MSRRAMSGQAKWPYETVPLNETNLEPFQGWKETPKGKPPGIGCEG